ncbi:class 3 adenylate cyclase/tetratricopeptide (TPR) repeat protein [Paraburkholderia atlantica]|uniref:Class 3 adenylate cyclase/tetratricopeptide (TPR) repeat protein n=1 Tax=Paraburkholderia atlantica TaxID=2654982 RepID=A0A7W8V4Q9_PARAM|nr:adenylate/guanylate cyclase domain-containing protein [Paraburkholderia atlantica]MBB5423116.1 class 3 adenylate cyclase/tetratricopeptide (TPR) repeat protein [Paraburkholderia atlantica]
MGSIAEWLESLGLSEYVRLFAENGIDLSVLRDLTDRDLKDLGVLLGHRRKMLRAIAQLGDSAIAISVAAAPVPRDDADRRQITVMFCDLVGSTALSARLDPEDLRKIIRAYHRLSADVITAAGGFVAQYMGDGVLAYFGYPRAHEDDAERAVRAGLTLVEAIGKRDAGTNPSLRVRIGIATGVVIVGDLTGEGEVQERGVVGETPNLAARLQTLAEAGTVVISASTQRLTAGLFDYRDMGLATVKGFDKAVRVWQVLGPSGIESRFEALHTPTLTPIVGRDEEIELLLGRWQRAKNCEGQVVLLLGEPGIGKSRLTAALEERLEFEPHVRVRYFCSRHYQDSAFYPFISQLERAAGLRRGDTAEQRLDKLEAVLAFAADDLGAAASLVATLLSISTEGRYPALNLTPQQYKDKTLSTIIAQITGLAMRQPLLISFEDVHWADPSSLEALDRLVDRIATLPVLVIVTFRPEFVPRWIGRSEVMLLTLNRLHPRQQAEMIERISLGKALPKEITDRIIEHTDGIPLFVEELTKSVLESGVLREQNGRYVLDRPLPPLAIPMTLHASLMARLDRLAPVRDVAQIGAAIGRRFSYELISAVASMPAERLDDALDHLVGAELLFRHGAPPDAEYTFKHALVQDAAYSSLLRDRRQQLHARIAMELEHHFSDLVEQQPEILAEHCAQAGLTEKAARLWRRAGHNTAERAAHREASALFEKALTAYAAMPSSAEILGEIIDTRWELNHSLYPLGELIRDRANLENAKHLAEGLGDEVRLSRVLSRLAFTLCSLGDLVGAVEAGERALALAERRGDSDAKAWASMMLARSRYGRGEYERAMVHARQALDLLHEGIGHGIGPHESYVKFTRVNGRIWLVLCLAELGRFDEAAVRGQEATDMARGMNEPEELIFARHGVGRMHLIQGNFDVAVEALEPALAMCKSAEFPIFIPRIASCLGAAYASLGRTDEALVLLKEAVRQAAASNLMFGQSLVLALFGRVWQLAGQRDEALTHAHDAIDLAQASGERGNEAYAWQLLGDLVWDGSATAAKIEEAHSHYRAALMIAHELGMRPVQAQCLNGLSRLQKMVGNEALAEQHAADATSLCRAMGIKTIAW